MKTLKLYYRPSDMKLVHSVNGWPEKPTFIKGGVTSNDQWEVMSEEHEEALQKAIEEAVPLEDQFIAKNLIHKCMHSLIGRIKPLKHGEFYEVLGEVGIRAKCLSCNATSRISICKRDDCDIIKVARLLPDRELEKKEEPKKRFCGCTNGENCNAECLPPKWIAERILKARDAHINGDYNEVWHQLYSIADPEFKSLNPWETLEEIIKPQSP